MPQISTALIPVLAQILDRGMIVGFSFKRIFKRTLQANTYLGQQH